MFKILGFNKFTSKAGKPCCTLQLGREFYDSEKAAGSLGIRTVKRKDGSDFFLPDSCMDIAVKENVGKDCDIWFSENNYIAQVIIR